jgi:hypothetical protein
MTATVGMEIGIEVEAKSLFGGSKITAKISSSLARTWENSYSTT